MVPAGNSSVQLGILALYEPMRNSYVSHMEIYAATVDMAEWHIAAKRALSIHV